MFCEVTDIVIPWKKITRGLPKGNHIEVLSMDNKRFAYHLRGLLKDNANRRVISNDSLEKAIETFKTDAILERRTVTLHLRVAWKKKNQVICYDMTDENWSCIEIERDTGTWRLLQNGSLTGYPIAELRNANSKLAEQPVLFTRYGQRPQVLPDHNYRPDIMQQFIDRCTNIKDPKDQLLFKSYIITLFIPDIAHVILLLKGVKGAAKSILETEFKRIVDPSEIEELANKQTIEYTLPQLLAKVRATANEMGIDIDRHSTKFAWAKTPQSLSEELMHLSTLIEDSYGYKIERYKDTVGKNGRKKNNSVIKITDLSAEFHIRENNDERKYECTELKSLGEVTDHVQEF